MTMNLQKTFPICDLLQVDYLLRRKNTLIGIDFLHPMAPIYLFALTDQLLDSLKELDQFTKQVNQGN